jgi:glycosyltransferase involved in cell wall biosynthesis
LLVGANGSAYDIPQWMNSGCFRSRNQENLLAVDNQTRAFESYSPPERESVRTMAWGSYLEGSPGKLYNVSFDNLRPLSEFTTPPVRSGKNRLLSIVIPTHNRLELALDAIKTVREQNYQNWEISVFDNASSEDVGEAIRALEDNRIRCERSEKFLPVTNSWNRALNMARGEYVTLIGDDDGLAPGFFERIEELADQFEEPDVIFSALYQFFHPAVLAEKPLGIVQTLPTADFMRQRDYPFVLDKQSARRAVDNSLGLRRTLMFNMPAFTVRREFLESMRRDGEVLHPPFPDYYFANLVFDRASKIVVEPRPIAFQGISRASFGFTLFNQKTEEGFEVLGHKLKQDDLFAEFGHRLLPGPGYNSQYIMTMAHLAKAIGDPARQPDFARYRRIQINAYLASHGYPLRWDNEEAGLLWKQLSLWEKFQAFYVAVVHRLDRQLLPLRRLSGAGNVGMHGFIPVQYILNEGDYVKGSEVFAALQNGSLRIS